MIYRIYNAVFLAVTLLSLSAVQAQEGEDAVTAAGSQELDSKDVSAKAVAVSEVQMGWTTQAVLSSYTGDSHAEGYIDLLIPLLQNDNGMLFLYPRFGLSSDIDPGYSMGLGVRHYIPAIDAIIGANVFYDRYASPGGNYYNQLGLGLEVLTRWVDARFNYYIPDSSPNVIDSQNVRSRSVATSSAWGQPY
ncbi:MAG: inverse autotransporter beta domain-containing protein, partial [Verrucomicrobiota bacterium]